MARVLGGTYMPKLLVGMDIHVDKMKASNDVVWKILAPCLRIVSLFLSNSAFASWYDYTYTYIDSLQSSNI